MYVEGNFLGGPRARTADGLGFVRQLVAKCEEVLVKNHSGLMQEEFQRVRALHPFPLFSC